LFDRVVEMIAKKARLPKDRARKILGYLDKKEKFKEELEASLARNRNRI